MARDDALSVGMVGYAFMGAAHSQAWRNVANFFEPSAAAAHVGAVYLVGDRLASVTGLTETFVKERPLAGRQGHPTTGDAGKGRVTVDDAALFLAHFSGGAVATFEATRLATGRKNALRIEINGSRGSVAFDLERLNELDVYESTCAGHEQGFQRILVTEAEHPYIEAWWPPGHIIGWEHTFVHQARDLVDAIVRGADPSPTFAEGLGVQRVLGAVSASARDGAWRDVPA